MDLSHVVNTKDTPVPVVLGERVARPYTGLTKKTKFPVEIPTTTWSAPSIFPMAMDGGIIYGKSSTNPKMIASSVDNLATIVTGAILTQNIQSILVSGSKILVSIWDGVGFAGKIVAGDKVNGVTGPFVDVITFGLDIYTVGYGMHAYYDMKRSDNTYMRDYVLIAEYGKKTVPGNARNVYLSKDGGATFAVIFTGDELLEYHTHGVAYDQYMDRIWVSHGDGADNKGVEFSDDFGTTWVHAADWQPTLIIPMPKYVLFGSDDLPVGMYRWNREQEMWEKRQVGGDITNAYEVIHPIRPSSSGANNFARGPFAKDGDWVAYIAFIASSSGGAPYKSFLLATGDGGETFHTVFMDQVTLGHAGFTYGILGPYSDGTMVANYDHERNRQVMKFPKVVWETI